MMKLNEYLNDGANYQAVCVMAYIRNYYESIIDESYDKDAYERNNSRLEVSRYFNCREQGYTICLSYKWSPIVYISFAEHRNSDNLYVIINKGKNLGECPTSTEIWGEKSKWDYDKAFKYMQIKECGDYIIDILKNELHNAIVEEKIIAEYKESHPEVHYINKEQREQIIADAKSN